MNSGGVGSKDDGLMEGGREEGKVTFRGLAEQHLKYNGWAEAEEGQWWKRYGFGCGFHRAFYIQLAEDFYAEGSIDRFASFTKEYGMEKEEDKRLSEAAAAVIEWAESGELGWPGHYGARVLNDLEGALEGQKVSRKGSVDD